MKQIKKGNRLLAVALSVLLAFGGLPTAAFAEGQPVQITQGLCEHHQEHTAECGYVEGQPCEHEHSEDCYNNELTCGYDEEAEATASDSEAEHTHTQKCYALDCPHERGKHDDTCGYAEAQPCGYTCELCGKTDNEPEQKPEDETEQTTCTMTEGCSLADGHEGECATVPGEGEKETACTLTEGCTLSDGHEGGCVTELEEDEKKTACTLTEGCTLADGHEGACVTELPPADNALIKTITSWTFVGDDNLNEGELPLSGVSMEQQADFDIVVSMLPTGLSAVIEGETDPVPVDITDWSCPEYVRDDDDNWPITGEYFFTAELPEGYVCAPLPTVKVLIGGAELYGGSITGDGYSFNSITGHLTISSADGMAEACKHPDIDKLKIISVDIDDSITVIPNNAFDNCTNLTTITLPANLIEIRSHAFSSCRNLTLDALPDGVQKIYVAAFQFCERITLTSLPSSVNYIEGWAFNDCRGISSLTFTSTDAPTLAKYAFGNTHFPIYVPENGNGYDKGYWADYNTDKVISGAALSSLGISSGNLAPQFNRDVTSYTVSVGSDTDTITVTPTFGGSGTITVNGELVTSGNASPKIPLMVGQTTIYIDVTTINHDSRTYTVNVTRPPVSVTGVTLNHSSYTLYTNKDPNDFKLIATVHPANATTPTVSWESSNPAVATVSDDGTVIAVAPGTTTITATANDGGMTDTCTVTVKMAVTGVKLDHSSYTLYTNKAPMDFTLVASVQPNDASDTAFSWESSNPAVATVSEDGTVIAMTPGTTTITATTNDGGMTDTCTVTVRKAVTGITLDQSSYTLYTNKDPMNFTLAPSVQPADASDTAVRWESSNKNVAIVSDDGTVNAVAPGTTTITATTNDGDMTDTCTVTVRKAVTGITLDQSSYTLYTNKDPMNFTLGASVQPNDASDTAVSWESSNKNVATVSDDGTVIAVAPGTTTITAITDGGGMTATCTVTVRTAVTGVKLDHSSYTLYTNKDPMNFTLGASVQPNDASDTAVRWESSDKNVATVSDDGTVIAVAPGTTTITATTNDGGMTDTCTVTVRTAVTGITLDHSSYTLYTNKDPMNFTLGASVQPVDASDTAVSWESSNKNVATVSDDGTVIAMAPGTTTITATTNDGGEKASCSVTVKTYSSSGGSSSGNSSSDVAAEPSKPTETQPNSPTTGVIEPEIKVEKDGTVKVDVSDRDIQNAIDSALDQARKDGTQGNGIAVAIDMTGLKTQFNTLPLTLSKTAYDKLVKAGVKSLDIRTPQISLSLDLATLKTIHASATGDLITINAAKADPAMLPGELSTRPAYNLTITSGGNTISQFGGYVAITLPYALQAGEQGGNLQMAYVGADGALHTITDSSYDVDAKALIGRTNHFTVFGIVSRPTPAFSDIENHWAKDDILFVASRGLFSGTGEKVFSPDAAMTRGMFVTALGRLAGVNPASYQTRSFTDVKADAYYAAYVEWAAQKNIVNGTGEGVFSPDAPVTREQMAVMMTNYAGQMGYSIPAPLAAVTFADNDKIGAWAAKEVAAMQRAGIIKGKDGNRFDPQGNATRAEVSAVLRRFVEIVIDPATASGWVKNDSGHWLYYQGGKTLTGWQTIGKLRYYFNADGVMHEGWKQDTSTDKWYYWTNAGAATGWREIDGKWYYFNENGVMAVNTKIDDYEVGSDGARKENL